MKEDKTFDLMTQLYSEMKKGFKDLKEELREEIQAVNNKVTVIEQEHGKKLGLLLDGYTQLAEDVKEIKAKQESQEVSISGLKIDVSIIKADVKEIKATPITHDSEIKVIKGGKSKKVK